MTTPPTDKITDEGAAHMETIEATPQRPVYKKDEQPGREGAGTVLYMVTVDEGWRSSILCERMYGWAADWLVEQLQGKPFAPDHRP